MRVLSSLAVLATLALGLVEAKPSGALPHLLARNGSKEPSCNENEFYYDTRSCCLPNGGPSKPAPPPPSGVQCPTTHYYSGDQGCCVPYHPNPPPQPTCPKEWSWQNNRQCCTKNPSPPPKPPTSKSPPKPTTTHHTTTSSTHHTTSTHKPTTSTHKSEPTPTPYSPYPPPGDHHRRSKRNAITWDTSSCPTGLLSCPVRVQGQLTTDIECVDSYSDLASCGGCLSLGQGKDCSKISNAVSSSCMGGECVVEQCALGFKPSADESSCVSI